MKLCDMGDGVKGHYCIGKPMEKGSIYWQYWNDHAKEWSGAGTLYIGRDKAKKKMAQLKRMEALPRMTK